MVDRPIIFSAPMVRALLNGRKTMTRRLAWRDNGKPSPLAKVRRGHRLWVRETVRADEFDEDDIFGVRYLADDLFLPLPATDDARERHYVLRCYNSTDPDLDAYKQVPSIHMPRWASRITLEVTGARVEPLQTITNADALSEGVLEASDIGMIGSMTCDQARQAFADLWDHLHGSGAWDANPEVVAISFRVRHGNIDDLANAPAAGAASDA